MDYCKKSRSVGATLLIWVVMVRETNQALLQNGLFPWPLPETQSWGRLALGLFPGGRKNNQPEKI